MTISRNTGTALYGKTKEKSGEANHDVVVVDSLTLFFLSLFSLSIADGRKEGRKTKTNFNDGNEVCYGYRD